MTPLKLLGKSLGTAARSEMIDSSDTRETIQLACAVTELFCRDTGFVKQAQQQIIERRIFRKDEVSIAAELSRAAACDNNRQVVMRVQISIADAAAVENH